MRIHFESGGGVTGPAGRRTCTVDSDEIPHDLLPIIAALRRGEHEPAPSAPSRPDELYVELIIEDGGFRRTLSAPRRKLAGDLHPLLHWLEERSLSGGA